MTWCVKTITIQIGNSDDKLSQVKWSEFVSDVENAIHQVADRIHFFGSPPSVARWQNATWVASVSEHHIHALKAEIKSIRTYFNQDSAAWTEGETQFI